MALLYGATECVRAQALAPHWWEFGFRHGRVAACCVPSGFSPKKEGRIRYSGCALLPAVPPMPLRAKSRGHFFFLRRCEHPHVAPEGTEPDRGQGDSHHDPSTCCHIVSLVNSGNLIIDIHACGTQTPCAEERYDDEEYQNSSDHVHTGAGAGVGP